MGTKKQRQSRAVGDLTSGLEIWLKDLPEALDPMRAAMLRLIAKNLTEHDLDAALVRAFMKIVEATEGGTEVVEEETDPFARFRSVRDTKAA